MFEKITSILKWASIPVLIVVALLSSLAGRYEGSMNLTICLSAVVFVERAAWLKEYGWAAVSVAIVVIFSPLFLVNKIFLLMALLGVTACLAAVAAFRPRPVVAL